MKNYTYLTWSNFLILNISGAFIIRNNKRIQQLTIPSIKISDPINTMPSFSERMLCRKPHWLKSENQMGSSVHNTCCLALSHKQQGGTERERIESLSRLEEAVSCSLVIHKSQQSIPLIAFKHHSLFHLCWQTVERTGSWQGRIYQNMCWNLCSPIRPFDIHSVDIFLNYNFDKL